MYRLGEIVSTTIVGIKPYGVFVLDRNGRKGLIHVSECDDGYIKNLRNTFSIGEKIKAIVMEDDGDKKVVYNPNSTESKEDTTEATVPATVSPTQATDIALQSAEMASKALEGVNLDAKTSSQGNGSFIVWLIVMIAFMSVAFWFVFSSEKKKKKARYDRIKARANRSW